MCTKSYYNDISINNMSEVERTSKNNNMLEQWLPSEGRSPKGEFKDNFYYPFCYLEAKKVSDQLGKLGFHIKKAGISVAVKPYDVAEAIALLSGVLGPDMRTTISSYFLTLTPTKVGKSIPAYCPRTIISTDNDYQRLLDRVDITESVIKEWGYPAEIKFINEYPYCLYPEKPKQSSKIILSRIIEEGIEKKLNDKVDKDAYKQIVAILAGIGRNTSEVTQKVYDKMEKQVYEVYHGSTVVSLARMAMALVDWGMKNPIKPLFLVSTARLTNDQGLKIPQAYLLDHIIKQLGWDHSWLGMLVGKVGGLRNYPTSAVIVEIKPEQYQDALLKIRSLFNKAVKKMVSENSGLF